jgi:hypothetical protein
MAHLSSAINALSAEEYVFFAQASPEMLSKSFADQLPAE